MQEEEVLTGFNFENAIRNKNLLQHADKNGKKLHLPSAMKTGTTICGVVFKDGVVLGADTRATSGSEVCDKNCEKIHYMAPNIWCCGAGTAADTEKTTEIISSQLDLLRLQTDSESRVVSACTLLKRMLFRYQGHVSAALVLGGVDVNGAHLYSIHPHGSIDKGPYVTMGSGSLAAMAVFEADFEADMDEEAAIKLVKRAIFGGIFNDLGSGSNCDITIIRKSEIPEKVTRIRGYEKPNEVGPLRAQVQRPKQFTIPRGATEVLSSTFVPALVVEESTPMVL